MQPFCLNSSTEKVQSVYGKLFPPEHLHAKCVVVVLFVLVVITSSQVEKKKAAGLNTLVSVCVFRPHCCGGVGADTMCGGCVQGEDTLTSPLLYIDECHIYDNDHSSC